MKSKLTLKDIDQQIAQLQEQAAKIREAEKSDVIGRMLEAIAYYGITAGELGLGKAGKKGAVKLPVAKPRGTVKAAKPAKKARAGAGRIKYKDDAGNSWSGFGPKPRWFTQALADGKTVDALKA